MALSKAPPGKEKSAADTNDPAKMRPDNPATQNVHSDSRRAEATDDKATQFDGDPNPKAAPSTPLKPQDDTPFLLKKKSGPRDDQK
jgi:hypothetical protein